MGMETGRKAARKSILEKVDGLERPEENQSGLANRLLSLWSSGILAAIMVREMAHLAMQGGADHPEILALAKVGNWGAQTGNCHRQIINRFCPQIMLPEPFQVKVKCQDPKTSLEKEDWASIFLLHLQFAHLGEHYPMFFQKAFCLGKGDLEKFWGGVEKVKDDRLMAIKKVILNHLDLSDQVGQSGVKNCSIRDSSPFASVWHGNPIQFLIKGLKRQKTFL